MMDPSYVPDGRMKEILTDVDNLTEDKIDQVLDEFLQDLKNDALVAKGWIGLAYTLSKAAMNAYTRFVANKYLDFRVNSVYPGFVKTDLTYHTGTLSLEEGAAPGFQSKQFVPWLCENRFNLSYWHIKRRRRRCSSCEAVALLPDDCPSGFFFLRYEVSDF